MLSPFPNVVIESRGLCQEGDSFGYHHRVSVGLSPGMCKLLPLIQLLNEAGGGFLWVVWPHNLYSIFFQVDIFNLPVGPENMTHHLQGRELSKTCQLVLDGVQEDGFHVSDYLFLECPIDGVVPSEQRLVLT